MTKDFAIFPRAGGALSVKCYFCETNEAVGVCIRCGRGLCKDHGDLITEAGAIHGASYNFLCRDCNRGEKKGMKKGSI